MISSMVRLPAIAAGALVASSVLWAVELSGGSDPFGPGAGAMAAVGMALVALVLVVGLLIARGRWARNVGIAVSAGQVALGFVVESNAMVNVSMVAALAAIAALAAPPIGRWVNSRPSSDSPPPLATALLTGLVTTPLLVAMASPSAIRATHVALAVASPLAALAVGRASRRALWAVRLGLPLLATGAAVTSPLVGGIAIALGAALLTAWSWSKQLSLAVTPLAPLRAPGYRIPPQLAPREILDAAGLDDEGRPR